jgi:zinc-finger-containing domain
MAGCKNAVLCDYCGGPAEFLPESRRLYRGKDWGPVWHCAPCGAWVGCHPGTTRPLGRLADADLRWAKAKAHEVFDPLWRARMTRDGLRQGHARAKAYRWLAAQLGIERSACHIGMFDLPTARRAIEICSPYLPAALRICRAGRPPMET